MIAGGDDGHAGREPDFVVIGAMKAGTTWLFRSLEAHPDFKLPQAKELRYLAGANAHRGWDWYVSQFPRTGLLTGEATPSYLDPQHAPDVARRVRERLPAALLVATLREPLSRARSHYVHEVIARRSVPAPADVYAADGPFIRRSLYWSGLAAFDRELSAGTLHVTTLDDLTSGDGWRAVLKHLGVPYHPPLSHARNEAQRKLRMHPWLREIVRRGYHERLPSGLRRLLRRAVPSGAPAELASALQQATVPAPTRALLRGDLERLAQDVPMVRTQAGAWLEHLEDQ